MAGYYLMYLRKSRADAEKERYGKYETLAVHEQQLTELARRERLRVAQIYRELVSGETIDARTEFKKVMDRIADPDCKGVIVHAVDRLGRGDPIEYGWILSSLRFTRTLVVTPGRTYDPNDPDDVQQLKTQMFISNLEFDHIRARLVNGTIGSAERGNYIGSKPPYGYDKVPGKSAIVPNEHEAPVVRRIFAMACDGYNKGAIARALDADGILTRHGKRWCSARIGTILSNPVYRGWVRYGYRRQRVVSRDGLKFVKQTRVSGVGEYVLVKGVHEALVSEEMWAKAQQAFEANPVHRDMTMKNPLSGMIVCGKCGRALVRQVVTNKYGSRYERLHHAYNSDCGCRSVSLNEVVNSLSEALAITANNLELGVIGSGTSPDEIEALERAMAAEDRKLDKLLELYYAEAITVSEFKQRRDTSEELVAKMRERHDKLTARAVDPIEIATTTREAIRLLASDDVSAEVKNDFLRRIIDRIEYWREDRRGGRIRLVVHMRGIDPPQPPPTPS